MTLHKELRGAVLGEGSDLSGGAWQDAKCSIHKEFRAVYRGMGVEFGGIKEWDSER